MNILAPLLKPLGEAIGRAIFAAAVEWLKDPANRADAENVGNWLIDKLTNATPWTWDDKLLDGLATRIAGALKIPGLDGLSAAITQLQQIIKNPLGGLLGGGR
ncbi:hypothetical protein ABQF35_14155 [Mycobacterium syngnathidarum]